jgi:DNA-binding FadR family transcriptional regulator
LVEAWLPGPVAEGRRLSREAALERLLERYLRGAVYARPRDLARLFGVERAETRTALARLVRRGVVLPEQPVAGWPGTWVVHRAAAGRRPES